MTGGIYRDLNDWIQNIYGYYSRENQAKFGLLAIECSWGWRPHRLGRKFFLNCPIFSLDFFPQAAGGRDQFSERIQSGKEMPSLEDKKVEVRLAKRTAFASGRLRSSLNVAEWALKEPSYGAMVF